MLVSGGVNSGIGSKGKLISDGNSVSDVFKYADNGLIIDPSRIGTLFQDDAGTTPVSADGQSVGRVLDISGRGNHATQSVSASRPTYQQSSGLHYLLADGIDDFLTVASFTMGASGRTIIAAMRKDSDATQGTVIEHRPTWTSALGGIALYAPSGTGGPATAGTYGSRYWNGVGPSGSQVNTATTYPAPHVAVVSAINATGSHVLRVNGLVAASQTHAGVIDQISRGMTIGMRDGTSLPASMRLYAMLVIDRVLSAAELAAAEKWAALKCGVTL